MNALTQSPASGATELATGPRKWVLIAGALMAFGWLSLIAMFVLAANEEVATAFAAIALSVMVPVNIGWRFMLRRERAKADPEGFAAEKKARRRASRKHKLAILGWGMRGAGAKMKHSWKADSKVRVRTNFGDEYVDYHQVAGEPGMGKPPGFDREFMMRSARWWGPFLGAFFTPMRAAVSEWRARH